MGDLLDCGSIYNGILAGEANRHTQCHPDDRVRRH